jgi:8-oxo-dGTP diphosphatase
MDVRYCPRCATELIWRLDGERERPACPACGFVFYFNPVVGAGALVEEDGRVILVRRRVEPKAGYWSLPAGYVEADELAEEAAIREMREETGLLIEIDGMLGVYSFGREPQTGVLLLYSGHVVGGELQAGDDAQAVQAFAPDELPSEEQVAFHTHLQALRDWRQARAIVYRQATREDWPAVVGLSQTFPEIGNRPPTYLDSEEHQLLIAEDQGDLVGMVCIHHPAPSRVATIGQVFVRPNYRRWGIATQLVGLAIRYAQQHKARTLLAEAPITNPVLLVYLKAGFRVSGFIDTYYSPAGDEAGTALFLAYDLG